MVRAIGRPFVPLSVDSPLSPSASAHTMSSQAGWNSVTGIATLLLGGNLIAIAIAIVIAFGVPIFLHFVFYRAAASPPSSNFLLLGPSGAGKTAFTTLVRPNFPCFWYGILHLHYSTARIEVCASYQKVAQHVHLPDLDSHHRYSTPDGPHCVQPLPIRK